MMNILRFGNLIFIAILVACSSAPITSSTDSSIKIGQYKTYQWVDNIEAAALHLDRPHFEYVTSLVTISTRPEIDEKVRPMIEESLRTKGYIKINHGKPDFLITYYAKAKNNSWISTWSGTTQGQNDVPIVIFPRFSRDQSFAYEPGNLYLVLYDPHTNSSAWTGTIYGPNDPSSIKQSKLEDDLRILVGELKKDAEKSG